MTKQLPIRPIKVINNLNEFDESQKSLRISAKAKNIDRLRELDIENLWIEGANDKELTKILSFVRPRYLNIWKVLVADLTILESQPTIETVILFWNTKASSYWDFSKNTKLRTLEITDFPKVHDIKQLSLARQIDSLTLGGGFNKAQEILSLNPISTLTNLKYLCLTNLKITDNNSLQPLSKLKNLVELEIPNLFDIKEYAWLSTRLRNVKCDLFEATTPVKLISNNELIKDTRLTGKGKLLLLSTKDKIKIDKHIADFEKLKIELADYSNSR